MKKVCALLFCVFFSLLGFASEIEKIPPLQTISSITIRSINLKRCVEESLLGKEEKKQIERIKVRLEQNGQRLEEQLDSLSAKMRDEDYLETLSKSALDDLKKKLSLLHQEYSACQNQYYQVMNQANYAMVNKITEQVRLTVEEIVENKTDILVLNSEVFLSPISNYDITQDVILAMDKKFQEESGSDAQSTLEDLSKVE